MILIKKLMYFDNTFLNIILSVKNTHERNGNMIDKRINLYIDFDGVIMDTIRVSYKMMEDLGIDLSDRDAVIKFYQNIDWSELLANSEELKEAFKYINMIYDEGIYNPIILTTVNSLQEMTAKINYVRSKNDHISVICVPSGIEKSMVVNAAGSILVDDYSGNLIKWANSEGVSIKFGYDEKFVSINSLEYFVRNKYVKKRCLTA